MEEVGAFSDALIRCSQVVTAAGTSESRSVHLVFLYLLVPSFDSHARNDA